jgi:isopenicillin N synthase-like dioxygenase
MWGPRRRGTLKPWSVRQLYVSQIDLSRSASFTARLFSTSVVQGSIGTTVAVTDGSAATAAPSIDTIDISAWTDPGASATETERIAVARKVGASFERTGFALVVGHGVPRRVFDDVRVCAYEFFELPQSTKAKYSDGRGYGFGGYLDQEENGAQLLGDFSRPGLGDHVESVSLAETTGTGSSGVSLTEQTATAGASGEEPQLGPQGRAAVARPTTDGELDYAGDSSRLAPLVTEAVHGFASATERYFAAMRSFSQTLDRLAEAALDLPPFGFEDVAKIDSGGGLRLAFYPDPIKRPPLSGQQRYGAHVDSGGITILKRDSDNPAGLQVFIDGQWVEVPGGAAAADSIVLNVGALLSRYTNNRWKASKHRVLNGDGARLSIVSGSVSFKSTAMVSVLPTCVSPERPAVYEPVNAGDFISERAAMHRLDYTSGKTEEELAQLSSQIQAYQV